MPTEQPDVRYYEAFDDLMGVYLEDSWVLGIEHSLSSLVFELDLVLTRQHPAYRAPIPDETHCYRRAAMRVDSDSAVQLQRSSVRPAVDAAGEVDYGHIDTFGVVDGWEPTTWELTGDWGTAIVSQPRVRVEIDQDDA